MLKFNKPSMCDERLEVCEGTFAPYARCFTEHLISCLGFEKHLALMMRVALVPLLHCTLNRTRQKIESNGHERKSLACIHIE